MNRHELSIESIKAAPPVAVAGATVAGVSLSDIVLVVTLIYLVLQIGFLLYKWARLIWNDDK
jgi:hypothetical protein